MVKEGYYFPHFTNARNDIKILKIRRVLGIEGYAIYFMLLEILREQTDFKYKIENIPELEFEFRTSKEKIFDVITNYDLFTIDNENKFFSIKLIENLQPYLEKSANAREAAKIRWSKAKLLLENNANAMQMDMQMQNDSNTSKVKESKVKEIKLKEEKPKNKFFVAPSQNEVENYFLEIGLNGQAKTESEKFFNYYTANGWQVGKNKMKNWQAACRNWKNNIDKYQTTNKINHKPMTYKEVENNPDRMKFPEY
jgi:hypothetical protein